MASSSRDQPLPLILAGGAALLAAVTSAGYLLLYSPSSSSSSTRFLPPSVKASLHLSNQLDTRALRSLSNLLEAFGPHGKNAPGCPAGTMVASPSRPGSRPGGKDENESYFFQWPRDGGLCLREVIRRLISAAEVGVGVGVQEESAAQLETIVRDFVKMNVKLQHTSNRAGTFETGGLGEAKFEVDGSPFEADWGRPQNDGPAIRAIALTAYALHLLEKRPRSHDHGYVVSTLYNKDVPRTIIKADLDYVARAWTEKSFELWEEVCADAGAGGGHFHMLMVQRRALLAGAKLASHPSINDEASAARYREQARKIHQHLDAFWNPDGKINLEGGPNIDQGPMAIRWDDARNLDKIPKEKVLHAPHVVGTLSRLAGQQKPTQADTAVLLGFLHGFSGDVSDNPPSSSSASGSDGKEKEDLDTGSKWTPWSSKCLATLYRLVHVFKSVYPINAPHDVSTGVLLGRYPEDVYDGVQQSIAHPWFLCTHAVAEVLYVVQAHYAASSWLPIDAYSLPFYQLLVPTITTGTYARGSKEYDLLLRGLLRMADGYLEVAGRYAAKDDKMSEQINRYSSQMRGARELSWSYASFLSAWAARRKDFIRI